MRGELESRFDAVFEGLSPHPSDRKTMLEGRGPGGSAGADLQSAEQAMQQAASAQTKLQAEAQYASALAENATVCAKGALSGLDRIFTGPSVNTALVRAAQDVQSVAAQCKATLNASG